MAQQLTHAKPGPGSVALNFARKPARFFGQDRHAKNSSNFENMNVKIGFELMRYICF